MLYRNMLALLCVVTGSFGLPAALSADELSDAPAASLAGPELIAPQNSNEDESTVGQSDDASLPPAPEPAIKNGSSRRQWLRLGRVTGMSTSDESASAPKLAYDETYPRAYGTGDMTLINDCQTIAGNTRRDPSTAPPEPIDLWDSQRLKRVLIDRLGHSCGYDCEQTTTNPGPSLLPPQQAVPLAAASDAAADKLQLQANEPAKVILDIRDKVGPKMFEGTIFEEPGWRARTSLDNHEDDARAQLVRCIRELAQSGDQGGEQCCGGCCEFDTCDPTNDCQCSQCQLEACAKSRAWHTAAAPLPARPPEALNSSSVPALRQASRQLDSVAEMLEEQRLYERADELRGMAQTLRQQARENEGDAPTTRSAAR